MKNNLSRTQGKAFVLIAIGTFFFLSNFGYLDSISAYIDWRLIFVVFAIASAVKGRIAGLIIFTLLSLSFYGYCSFFMYWPLALIGLGIKKIWDTRQSNMVNMS